jgi:thiol-disulfide isomerase/thioredoxin
MVQNSIGLILWIILCLSTLYYLYNLKLQIHNLPRGINLKEIDKIKVGQKLLLPSIKFNGELTILVIVSPTCPPCHAVLEKIIQDNKIYKIPIFVLAETKNQEDFKKLVRKYDNIIKINPFTISEQKILQIRIFPTIICFSKDGIVKSILHEYNPKKLYGVNHEY